MSGDRRRIFKPTSAFESEVCFKRSSSEPYDAQRNGKSSHGRTFWYTSNQIEVTSSFVNQVSIGDENHNIPDGRRRHCAGLLLNQTSQQEVSGLVYGPNLRISLSRDKCKAIVRFLYNNHSIMAFKTICSLCTYVARDL